MVVNELATTWISRMAMNMPTHIAPKPNQSRRVWRAAGSGGRMTAADVRGLAAQRRAPRENRRKGADQLRAGGTTVIVHRQPREQRGGMQAHRELPFPDARIVSSCSGTVGEQTLRQQPRRLDRHADAFGDDRMGLAGGIARKEYAVAITPPDTRSDRTDSEDGFRERRALQRSPHAFGARQNVANDCLARLATPRFAGARERITADAARQADAASI